MKKITFAVAACAMFAFAACSNSAETAANDSTATDSTAVVDSTATDSTSSLPSFLLGYSTKNGKPNTWPSSLLLECLGSSWNTQG